MALALAVAAAMPAVVAVMAVALLAVTVIMAAVLALMGPTVMKVAVVAEMAVAMTVMLAMVLLAVGVRAAAMVEALAVVAEMETGFSSKSPPQLPGAKHSALNLTKMLTLPTQARTWLPSMRYVVVAWQLRSLPHLVPVLGRCPFALLWWRWWLR